MSFVRLPFFLAFALIAFFCPAAIAQESSDSLIFERGGGVSSGAASGSGSIFIGPMSARPGFQVGVKNMTWTAPDGAFQVRARAYYPADKTDKSPVVIFSHGLGGSGERFEYLGTAWAQRGIASIFLSHPGSDETHWRGKLRPMNRMKGVYEKYWSARDRALMIRFALDRLDERAGRSGTVAERFDLARVGVAGNDLGALAALLLAGQLPPDNGPSLADERVTAVIAFSPPVYCSPDRGQIVYAGVKVPFISFAGTNDDGVVGTTKAPQRRIPFDAMAGNPRYHVTLQGGDHMVYSGHISSRKKGNDPPYQRSIRDISTIFWAAYLLGDERALGVLNYAEPAMLSNMGHLERKLR